MLNINIEFSKGVLFVRLSGILNKDNSNNIKNNIIDILLKSGIKYLVFNLEELIKLNDISLFEVCEKIIKKNNGKMIVCGNYDINFEKSNNELTALRTLLSC